MNAPRTILAGIIAFLSLLFMWMVVALLFPIVCVAQALDSLHIAKRFHPNGRGDGSNTGATGYSGRRYG